jgi:hypothetical protein
MSTSALLRQSDLRRMATIAKKEGVRVEIERDGFLIRVLPDRDQKMHERDDSLDGDEIIGL